MTQNNVAIRSLREDEIEQWYDHLAECFSTKRPPTPRQYFSNHYENDPYHDHSTIIVAVQNDGTENKTIISTARIFQRSMYLNGTRVSYGGLGEVSTKTEYRGKGIAFKVLQKTNEVMKNRGIQIGALHAGNDLIPFYSKVGYVSVPLRRALISIKVEDIKGPHLSLVAVTFERDDVNQALTSLHKKNASRFNGTIVRESVYWSTWMHSELVNPTKKNTSAWVLVSGDINEIKEDEIVAYGLIQLKGIEQDNAEIFMRDYITNIYHPHAAVALKNLICAFTRHLNVSSALVNVGESLISHERNGLDFKQIIEEYGYMYQLFDQSLAKEGQDVVELVLGTKKEDSANFKHAFLSGDGY